MVFRTRNPVWNVCWTNSLTSSWSTSQSVRWTLEHNVTEELYRNSEAPSSLGVLARFKPAWGQRNVWKVWKPASAGRQLRDAGGGCRAEKAGGRLTAAARQEESNDTKSRASEALTGSSACFLQSHHPPMKWPPLSFFLNAPSFSLVVFCWPRFETVGSERLTGSGRWSES